LEPIAMLFTLSAASLAKRMKPGPGRLELHDLPKFAREHLGLHGLSLPTSMLAGLEARAVDRLRDEADKAGAPILTLIESTPQPLGHDGDKSEAAIERMTRVLQVGHRLGCNAAAVAIVAGDTPAEFATAVASAKRLLDRADRLEINLLLAPHAGLTDTPDKVTALIKRIGGFRIGSMPDFQAAAASGSAVEYLRRVTPYAQAVVASSVAFAADGSHEGYDLAECLEAVSSVGFEGALAIEYRGKGEAVDGLNAARRALDAALKASEA
jgi:sugar phosphate isomerase/epimerase